MSDNKENKIKSLAKVKLGTIKEYSAEQIKSLNKIPDYKTNHNYIGGSNQDAITSIYESKDGKYLFTGSTDNSAKCWDIKTGKCVMTFEGHNYWVYSIFQSRDGKYLFTGSGDNTAKCWDIKTGKCVMTFEGHNYWVYNIFQSRDGKYLFTGSGDNTAKCWDI